MILCAVRLMAVGLLLLGFFFSSVRQELAQDAADKPSRTEQEDEIREVVLRSQMLDWITSGEKSIREATDATEKQIAERLNFTVFYVSIDDNDPSDDFLNRLKDVPRTIKKVSASEIDRSHRLTVVDKETHTPGIIFYVEKVRWRSLSSVDIDGGYHCDGLCAAGSTFRLKRVKGKWIIQREKMNWVS